MESACNAGDLGSIPQLEKICWRRDRLPTPVFLGFPCGSAGKESACNAGDLGSIPGLGRSPQKGKATRSSILAWRIPRTVGPWGRRVKHDWATFIFTFPGGPVVRTQHFHSWGAVCIALAAVVISFHMILTLDVSYSAMALFSYFYDFGGKQLTKLDFLYVLKNLW